MSSQPGGIFGHQHEPERLIGAISHIENKALDVKTNIEQLLFMLDLQKEVEWYVRYLYEDIFPQANVRLIQEEFRYTFALCSAVPWGC